MGGQVRNSVGASVFLLSFCLFFLVAIKVPAFKDWRKSFVVVPNSSYKRRVSRFIMSFPGGWIWKYYEIDKFSVLNSNLLLSLSCLTLLVLGDFLLTLYWGGGVCRPPHFLQNYKRYNNKTYSHCSLDNWLLKYNNDN